MSETLTWASPIETEKIRTHHAKIVIECTTGHPYYSIEWYDPLKKEYYLGYSSYNIDNVLGWLREYFEIVEAPETNAERIRTMSDKELATWITRTQIKTVDEALKAAGLTWNKSDGLEEKTITENLEWLKRPAENVQKTSQEWEDEIDFDYAAED